MDWHIMVVLLFWFIATWYYAIQHMIAIKRGSTIRRNILIAEGWKLRLAAWQAKRYGSADALNKALEVYQPIPLLVPSYEQERPTRISNGELLRQKEQLVNGRIAEFVERG
jgi:hypothetical protein